MKKLVKILTFEDTQAICNNQECCETCPLHFKIGDDPACVIPNWKKDKSGTTVDLPDD